MHDLETQGIQQQIGDKHKAIKNPTKTVCMFILYSILIFNGSLQCLHLMEAEMREEDLINGEMITYLIGCTCELF